MYIIRYDMQLYYIAELVCAEKEQSDWLPERSEYSYTDRLDGPLVLQRTFQRGKVFQY